MLPAKKLNILAWSLSFLTVALAFTAWAGNLQWQFGSLYAYALFPLFGLVAFSLMWGHYVMAAVRRYVGLEKAVLRRYFEVTSLMVLVALLLHPALLSWQLWRDGFGVPPQSYQAYVGQAGMVFVLLGSIALVAFLAYEFRRKFEGKKWWSAVQLATDAAMIAIFFHALKLGGELQGGWYRSVWWFYGATLAGLLVYLYWPAIKSLGRKHSPR